MSPPSDPVPGGPYAAWKHPAYRLYGVSWFLMVFGKQIETVAVGVHLYDETGDALSLGLLGLVQALPVIVLAIAGGQLADRFERRHVLMLALGASLTVSLGLFVVSVTHAPVSWMYWLLGLGAVAAALGGPSRSALLPQLVPDEIFANAVTWNSSVFQMATMIGPAVGGLVIGLQHNTAPALAMVAACRLLSLLAVAGIRCPRCVRVDEAVSLESVLAGIRFVWRTKLVLASIALDMFAVLLGGATYLLPIFAKDILHVGATGLGLLRSAEAIGAVAMAMLIAHLPPMRRAGRTLLWAVAGFGVATIVYGVSQWFWLSMAAMFCIGACDNVSVVVRHTLVQMLTPDAMRGRVSAVNNIFITASNDLGGFESGVTARLFGPVLSVVSGGVGAIVVVLGAAKVWPELVRLGSLRDVRPVTPVAEPVLQPEAVSQEG